MEALKHFSVVTGLEANLQKYNIFLVGMTEEENLRILYSTRFSMMYYLYGIWNCHYPQKMEQGGLLPIGGKDYKENYIRLFEAVVICRETTHS